MDEFRRAIYARSRATFARCQRTIVALSCSLVYITTITLRTAVRAIYRMRQVRRCSTLANYALPELL